MPSSRFATLVLILFGQALTSSAFYTWPLPALDVLEDIYTVSSGLGQSGLSSLPSCGFAPGNKTTTGRQDAAEWLRLAFHDMASHNTSDGTGGLDASIQFELDRPQNVGAGMRSSLDFFLIIQSAYTSMADSIALGIIHSIKVCSGPSISFRGGRIDAKAAGPATIPEPQQDLASHIASFANQGFNLTEMIGLVACGHTIGGIHQANFPTIVHDNTTPDNTDGVVHFTSTPDQFNNNIATEWIDSTTTDPLAVGQNQTTNSDARIFAADGNTTMRAFAADSVGFANRCGELLGRMLDTVPKDVTLSELFVPLPVKPWSLQLSLAKDGKLHLGGYIRFFSADAIIPPHMAANITWADRTNTTSPTSISSLLSSKAASLSPWGSVAMLPINATIDPTHGISSFVIDSMLAPAEGTSAQRAENNGVGFPVQDVIMLDVQNSTTCVVSQNQTTVKVTAAIRNDRPLTSAVVSYTSRKYIDGSPVPQFPIQTTDLVPLGPSSSPLYTMYQAKFDISTSLSAYFDLIAVVDGVTYTDMMKKPIAFTCPLRTLPVGVGLPSASGSTSSTTPTSRSNGKRLNVPKFLFIFPNIWLAMLLL